MHYGRWQVSLAILVATLTAKIAYALVYGFATHITVKTKNEHQNIKTLQEKLFHNLKILCFFVLLGSCLALKGSSR